MGMGISCHPEEGLLLGKKRVGQEEDLVSSPSHTNFLVLHSWKCWFGLLSTNGRERESSLHLPIFVFSLLTNLILSANKQTQSN